MSTYTLLTLQTHIRRILALNLPEPLWLRAEVFQVSESRGHLFMELAEKGDAANELAAQASAVLWERNYRQLRARYGKALDALLAAGVEIRIKARVDYHERYGLKLVVEDVDPDFTLGQLELRRRQTLEMLQREGLLERNAALPLPAAVQRIAVVSAETAAGYHDFHNQLLANPYGYAFSLRLFPAAVQGAAALVEIPRQLRAIGRQTHRFDAVVIIRGGGSRIDLAAFDELELCRAAAECPLPVLAGIGHETDETLLDRVAWQALKTPTAVAEWLLARSLRCDAALADTALQLQQHTQRHLRLRSQELDRAHLGLRSLSRFALRRQAAHLDRIGADWPRWARRQLKTAARELDHLARLEQLLSLDSQLNRGFALVIHQGRIVKNWQDLPSDTLLELRTAAGSVAVKRVGE